MPTTTADQPAQGPSLEEAASRLEGLLHLPEAGDDKQPPDTAAAEEAPADDDEGVAAEATSEETAADEAVADEAEATEADEETEATDDKDQLVTVTIDGKATQVPLKEALSGYQRHSDYSRKTAELANERRTLGEQAQAVSQERQVYATMLTSLRNQLQQTQEAEPDWNEVYASDPVGYARRRDEWRDKQEKIAAANYELHRVDTLRQREQAENVSQMVRNGREKMLEINPAWRDQKVWEAERPRIVEYAQKIGYSADEIANAYDPRAIVMLDKARRYDELMAAKPKPVAARGPKVTPAGAAPSQGNVQRLNSAQQRLAKSGRIEDAAKVFEQLI